ncbi:MAG TPA: hypothetical protein VMJ10_24435 [Kofleriaceae bacterium]|nr:hypothetical protein [Kofleriaceae bacterium]
MGEAPCDVLDVEVALDLVEGELAAELPAHMRAFARAHADGRPPPAAPLVARLASTIETARRACRHDVLAERGLALLRLAVPLALESDPAVARARGAAPSWDGLAALAAARDAVATARFGATAIALLHRLHGIETVGESDPPEPGPPVERWQDRDGTLEPTAIDDAWQAIAARLGLAGTVRVDRARTADARPRTFVIEPRVEVIVVVPNDLGTPAARFAVLHELGHAAAALVLPAGVPRVLDEAVASYIARLAEPPKSWLPARWSSELALPARRRRAAIATALDWIERALPTVRAPVGAVPPWALWHDPGAQASYVAAEVIADRLHRELGPNPPRGQLARVLGFERERIDRRTRV